ncbi:MAG: four helix bundle protein [Bacillota bacterium]
MRRSAVSIASNIAEGNDRESNKKFIRYLYISKGSGAELATQIITAKDIGYLSNEVTSKLIQTISANSRMIGLLI